MKITQGSVVISRAGHDKGRVYAVLSVSGGYVEVAEGRKRTTAAPKRKNVRYLAYLGKLGTADAKSLENHILRELLSSWR